MGLITLPITLQSITLRSINVTYALITLFIFIILILSYKFLRSILLMFLLEVYWSMTLLPLWVPIRWIQVIPLQVPLLWIWVISPWKHLLFIQSFQKQIYSPNNLIQLMVFLWYLFHISLSVDLINNGQLSLVLMPEKYDVLYMSMNALHTQ